MAQAKPAGMFPVHLWFHSRAFFAWPPWVQSAPGFPLRHLCKMAATTRAIRAAGMPSRIRCLIF
jgi:hypothetical protein